MSGRTGMGPNIEATASRARLSGIELFNLEQARIKATKESGSRKPRQQSSESALPPFVDIRVNSRIEDVEVRFDGIYQNLYINCPQVSVKGKPVITRPTSVDFSDILKDIEALSPDVQKGYWKKHPVQITADVRSSDCLNIIEQIKRLNELCYQSLANLRINIVVPQQGEGALGTRVGTIKDNNGKLIYPDYLATFRAPGFQLLQTLMVYVNLFKSLEFFDNCH
jgi:hypothetical protein